MKYFLILSSLAAFLQVQQAAAQKGANHFKTLTEFRLELQQITSIPDCSRAFLKTGLDAFPGLSDYGVVF